ncbi:uncharacterized protein CMC5_011880 [Chondromyces crocatus]|uniref:Methyltransferase n=2 Tax=Chondromyces crocatus TaxID=52 RepID=A0A0K1E8S1_CHOCO|nr:uncharacterized protein CMC5_011880 [Chondromyces crocatus]
MTLDNKAPCTTPPPSGNPASPLGFAADDLPPDSEIAPSQEVLFDSQIWKPDQYASIYYPVDQIGSENLALLECEVEIWKRIRNLEAESGAQRASEGLSQEELEAQGPRSSVFPGVDMVVIGGGGTLWDLPPAAPYVSGICYTDPHENSRTLIQQYLNNKDDRRWDSYIARTLQFEGETELSSQAIRERDTVMRKRITSLTSCDIRRRPPVDVGPGGVRIVSAHFVIEALTNNRAAWRRLMRNTASIVGDRGYIIIASVGRAKEWRSTVSDEKKQPATYVTEEDIESVLNHLGFDVFFMRWIPSEEANADEYAGIISCAARRRARA